MPKTVYFGKGERAGIDITWTKTTRMLSISGWYDSMVGIEGETVALEEFCRRLGIRAQDLRAAALYLEAGHDSLR